jgi:hypothetical protein
MAEVSFAGGTSIALEVKFVSWDWHSFRVKSSMACSEVLVSAALMCAAAKRNKELIEARN